MAIIETFGLSPSPLTTINGHEEVSVNFSLQASENKDVGNITGSVRLSDGTRIPFATIMIFTSNNVPFDHTNSNAAGQFSFPRVPVGS
ncbi:carboxypeptidase-like regulatory domain-containing protein [Peribacillus sp. Hz7]|uniref:carboxypeptidase-like regulatory domain-containing protein n=1 Tax=Peribacillus sp. Hz7 TaxID=3344873 RepID=UPI0035C9E9E1